MFEGTACLQYLTERFDQEGVWSGKNAWERGLVLIWVAYQTAGLGWFYSPFSPFILPVDTGLMLLLNSATAKFWLYFLRGYPSRTAPEPLPKTVGKLHSNCLRQWDILDKRLAQPGQEYIALPDRPTLADLSYFPFAMPWMFKFLGVDVKDWPNIEA